MVSIVSDGNSFLSVQEPLVFGCAVASPLVGRNGEEVRSVSASANHETVNMKSHSV